MSQAQASDIQEIISAGDPTSVGSVIEQLFARLQIREAEPIDYAPASSKRRTAYEAFLASLGPAHAGATLDNFKVFNGQAAKVLGALREYVADLTKAIRATPNILLLGPSGTGKDHLLVAIGKVAAMAGYYIQRIDGAVLLQKLHEAAARGEETRVIERLQKAKVLILSDPVPPFGGLTPYQAWSLWSIVDYRWQRALPTWSSLNVADSNEADRRLGPPIVDRLQDKAMVLRCNWRTYRKPHQIV